ncbi:undecaprenyl-diphosphatase [Clostridium acetobutylicum]|uniref:Predicted phosphatase n=1 Tax=Clostridium acetobutylicum (strain ATCC 824 / DSM 792 / JCM 1419 / IAM 19013 / LMG 5710 / NBRC 13948 / NRRL B-527 / VKM B-1787 / 2291 / W) TaxID=272562 RepID=Q97G34_CLOAB|nr:MULTISPECIES: undecaprenyl-diphosphatase [Clostridium]AAK80489.1 Predicted phosphatase [Clostridium acetobutylicum ATCC 824]ADZ21587.1 phosphatase [Clostridium acetobutylicum EA 2018]AEI34504.1 phosphatase [Clostridium acetobutylicum DSM 1731]AWV79094.1 undecaprenyl-diphosphatase [Clostridium acetobutylicum]MBC2394945.1 undecaprenyl-diphosphatase [Clostridium acetobutylicum]
MNMELFRIINNLASKNEVFDKVMIFFSKDVPYLYTAILAVVFVLGIVKNKGNYRKSVFSSFVITVINLIFSFAIGKLYYEDRPFVHNKVNLLVQHSKDASFPSDHATGTMSIALGLRNYNKLISRILILISLIVGFSRVYVGNHYPMDVLGAYIMVFVTNYIYNLKLRNKVENLYEAVEKKIFRVLGIKFLIQ